MNDVNSNISLKIPDYDIELIPGMTIRIGRFDHRIWLVGYGWYAWGGNRPVCGWYLTDTLSKEIKPLQYIDLEDIYVVDSPEPGPDPGPPAVLIEKTVTENGVYNAIDDDADGYSSVNVSVPEISLKSKTKSRGVTYSTSTGTYTTTVCNALIAVNGSYYVDADINNGTNFILLTPAKSIRISTFANASFAFTPTADFTGISCAYNLNVTGDSIVPGDGKMYYAHWDNTSTPLSPNTITVTINKQTFNYDVGILD